MSSKNKAIVEKLKKDNSTAISELYSKLNTNIKRSWNGTVQTLPDIMTCLCRDLVRKDEESANAALKFLSSFCNANLGQLDHENKQNLKPVVVDALMTVASEECVHEYFPGVFSNIPSDEFVNMAHQAVWVEKKKLSFAMKDEVLKLLSKLAIDQENVSSDLNKCCAQMLQIMLVLSVDESDVLRNHAVSASFDFIQNHPPQPTEIGMIIHCLKSFVFPSLNDIISKNESSILEFLNDQIPLYLKVIGINVKKSGSLTNALLKTIEKGFRHALVDVKSAAFKSWKLFIDELSVDLELLSSSRYMKLVMQPLTNVQSSESLNVLRIKTLWSLAQHLKDKLPALFPTVCLPILHCCLGNLDASRRTMDNVAVSSMKTSRSSGRLSGFYAAMQATGYRATPKKASKNSQLHDIGIEILFHLLFYAEEKSTQEISKLAMPKLDHVFLSTPATFSSYGLILITSVEEVLCNKSDISSELALLLWNRLHYHLNNYLEYNLQKKKREPHLFNSFLLVLKNILDSSFLPCTVTLTMLKSFLHFPNSILSSTFYGGSSNGVHGFPALTLLRLLFSIKLISGQTAAGSVEVSTCALELVTLGFSSLVGTLSFCNSVLDIMLSFAQELPIRKDEDVSDVKYCVNVMLQVWRKLGQGLKEHIMETQEVNQGDNVEHDFTSLYLFLLFPMRLKRLGRNYTETWDLVYEAFQWGSKVVTSCKANEICGFISSNILKVLDIDWSDSALDSLGHVCNTMAKKAIYNHRGFAKSRLSRHETMSPKKQVVHELALERHENLADLCLLLKRLLEISCKRDVPCLREESMTCLAHIFSSIYYSDDIKVLFQNFVHVLQNLVSTSKGDTKIFCECVETIFHMVENVYRSCAMENNMVFFQHDFHSLISECVQSQSNKIKNIAVEFWKNVIVDSQRHVLVCEGISDDAKSHLFPVYKRMGWLCPWKDVELPATLELTEGTDNTQSSDMMVAGYGAFGSPAKNRRLVSPRKSPLRTASPVKAAVSSPFSVKRKLDTISEKVDYVKCVSPFPKPRTPLTKRQKEKLRERQFIPTMYNELDERQEMDIEVDTQEENDHQENTVNEESASDIIKSSQSQESPKKKRKFDSTCNGSKKTRGGLSKGNSDGSKQSRILHNALEVADASENADKQSPPVLPNYENDGINDKSSDRNSSSNGDVSYEYVEMNDASTNQTQNNGDIDIDDDDDKDLGVTPLDDSYEYVKMVDMSVAAANFTNASIHHSSVDEEDEELGESTGKEMSDVSVHLERVPHDYQNEPNTNSPAKMKKTKKVNSKQGKICKKQSRKKQESQQEETLALDQKSTAQDDVANQHSRAKPLKKTRSSKSLKVQLEAQDSAETGCSEVDSEPSTLRRSTRSSNSRKKTAAVQENEDFSDLLVGKESPDMSKTNENPIVSIESKTQDVGAVSESSFEAENELSTTHQSAVHESDNDLVETTVEIDASVTGDGDTTQYEYVQVADSSCCNMSMKESLNCTEDDPILKKSPNDDSEHECVVISDVSMIEKEGDADVDCTTSIAPIGTSNSTFIIQDVSDEDDFLDARSSIGVDSCTTTDVSSNDIPKNEEDFQNADDLHAAVVSSTINEEVDIESKAQDLKEADLSKKNPDEVDVLSHLHESFDISSSSKVSDVLSLIVNDQASPTSSKVTTSEDLENTYLNMSTISPNAKGILKRRSIVGNSPSNASPGNKRRVSFAEPVSTGGALSYGNDNCTYVQQSPSSFLHRTRNIPRVSRRLSLQPERKRYQHENEVAVSPLSLRSVKVAQAIANIRAKDSNSPSRLSCNRTNATDAIDFNKISIGELQNREFLRSLNRSQGQQLFQILNSIELDLVTTVFGT